MKATQVRATPKSCSVLMTDCERVGSKWESERVNPPRAQASNAPTQEQIERFAKQFSAMHSTRR